MGKKITVSNTKKSFSNQKTALIVNPLNTWWSFQLTLELVFRYNELGYNTIWFNGAIRNTRKFEMNKSDFINPIIYRSPVSIIQRILLQHKVEGVCDYIKPIKKSRIEHKFKNIDDLRNYHLHNSPLGAIIFSGIASKLKHTGFSVEDVSKEIIYFLNYTEEMQKQLYKQIEKTKPSVLITINDRLPGSSLSLAIARRLNISTKVFYWGSGISKIVGYEHSLYDFDEWRCMISHKISTDKINLVNLTKANEHIINLAQTPSEDSKSFLKNQKLGTSIVKKNKKLIVFYAASEHEHSPLMFRKKNKFTSQYDAFEHLQQICLKLNYQLVIKYHPTRKNKFFSKKSHSLNDWKKIDIHPDVIQLMPDSSVDTYQLINDADINVTWSSTVGIESIVREKPTIIMGDTTWLNTSWGIHAWDIYTLEKLLESNSYSLKKEALIPWFYFMQDYGDEFRFVKTFSYNPSVNGIKVLQPRLLFSPLYKIAVKLKS